MYLLRAVDFRRLLDLNDVVWLLNLVLKFLAVSPMYVSVTVSELTLAWYIILSARQLSLSGHSFLPLSRHESQYSLVGIAHCCIDMIGHFQAMLKPNWLRLIYSSIVVLYM